MSNYIPFWAFMIIANIHMATYTTTGIFLGILNIIIALIYYRDEP